MKEKRAETATGKRLRIKRSGIRAIDEGTRYDVPGGLRKLARQIERGERGNTSDAVVILRHPGREATSEHTFKCFGVSQVDSLLAMVYSSLRDFTR